MPIIKLKSKIEEYKIRASQSDINEMSGRTKNPSLTKYILKNIAKEVKNISGNIVDIGCGDCSLYKILKENNHNISNYIGIVPTHEEYKRLSEEMASFKQIVEIKKGFSDSLPISKNTADLVIINGVILILKNKEEVLRTIKEIKRICKKGAVIFIGEVPFVDEMKNIKYSDSIFAWLIYVLHNNGLKMFIRKIIYLIKCILTKEIFMITTKKIIYFEVEEFIKILNENGFKVIKSFPHKEIDPNGNKLLSKTRYNYLAKI